MIGRPIPSTCRPAAGCKCEPIQLVDLEIPSRAVYLHRAEKAPDAPTVSEARNEVRDGVTHLVGRRVRLESDELGRPAAIDQIAGEAP
jgi:hypothetical protein